MFHTGYLFNIHSEVSPCTFAGYGHLWGASEIRKATVCDIYANLLHRA